MILHQIKQEKNIGSHLDFYKKEVQMTRFNSL